MRGIGSRAVRVARASRTAMRAAGTIGRFAARSARTAATVAGTWFSDRCMSMAAALAFYAAFSLAPMLLVTIWVAGVFLGPEAVQGRLYADIAALIGEQEALAVQAMVASSWEARQGGWIGLASVLVILVGATVTFAELNASLDAIWRVEPPPRPVAALIRVRLISFALVVGTGFLVVVLLIADAAITFATEVVLAGAPPGRLVPLVQRGVSFGFLFLAFTALLKVLPDCPVRWRHAAAGGAVAALLFTVGKRVFALYLAHAGMANVFGAASSLAVLLMWLFFSSAVFLLGAEFSALLSRRAKIPGPRRAGPGSGAESDSNRDRDAKNYKPV